MTLRTEYTALVPRLDATGLTNVAVDVARGMKTAGAFTRLVYLSGQPTRNDLDSFDEVRRMRWSDPFRLRGIVHTHGLRPDIIGAAFTLRRRCLVVSTMHGHLPQHLRFDYPEWKVQLAWRICSLALRRFDSIVCISETMLRHYRRTRPAANYHVVYNFRGTGQPSNATMDPGCTGWFNSQRGHGRAILIYVGSISKRKNIAALIQRMIEAPQVSLVVCGDGPLRPALEESLPLEARSRLLFLGHVDAPEILMPHCDALVLPSKAEGLPLVIIEAARCGIPSLMSNIAVHRELAAKGIGLTFDRHGFSDFADKAAQLSRERSTSRSNELRSLWEREFSPEVGMARYQALFSRLRDRRAQG